MAEVSREELFTMELHEDKPLNRGVRIMRVDGGWIYWKQQETDQGASIALAGVFVPQPE